MYTLTIVAPDTTAKPMIIPLDYSKAHETETWLNHTHNVVVNHDREWLLYTRDGIYTITLVESDE